MTQEELLNLTNKYVNGTASDAEKKLLQQWFDEGMDQEIMVETPYENEAALEQALYARIQDSIKIEAPVRKLGWRKWVAVAAAAAAILFISVQYFIAPKHPDATIVAATPKDFAAPGTSKAVITLANGQKISLDSLQHGTLANQGKMAIVKSVDGQILYQGNGTENLYNTLSNPRGSSVITLTLADGTRVWLNAESSLYYPAAMVGSERRVAVTGEAYFEVAHDAARPFIVKNEARNIEVTVLGTHFNINTYLDEEIAKVTLLEGSVKVAKNELSALLKPGEQAKVGAGIEKAGGVDTEQIMAWKDGYFQFNRDGLDVVLRQIGRWYDVEVVYEGKIPKRQFGGKINRNETLSHVFEILKLNNISYKIEGRKIVVGAKSL